MPAEESLKMQVKIQPLALEGKRKQEEEMQLYHRVKQNDGADAPSPVSERKTSLLDILVGSVSDENSNREEENVQDGNCEMVRNEVMMYFGELPIPEEKSPLNGGKKMRQGFPPWPSKQSHTCLFLQF